MAAPHFSSVIEAKAALRAAQRAARVGLDAAACGAAAAAHGLALDLPAWCAVAGTWPLPGELDARPLWHALHARGHKVLLQETPPRGRPLIFRLWHPGAPMVRERFGTLRPEGEVAVPDVIFVPFLAFDRGLFRLGYGGGFYDRTLAALPAARAIGLGFAALRVDKVPVEPHDQPLSLVVTDQGLVHPAF